MSLNTRREFLGKIGTIGIGVGLLKPVSSEAIGVDAIVVGVVAAIGLFKTIVSSFYEEPTENNEVFGILGSNFAPISPRGDRFHFKHSFNWAPSTSSFNWRDSQQNAIALNPNSLPQFIPAKLSDHQTPTDFNLSEIAYTRLMVQKNKQNLSQLIPVSKRFDVTKFSKDAQELSEVLILGQLKQQVPSDIFDNLQLNYKLEYARLMPKCADTATQSIGLGYTHIGTGRKFFWQLNGTENKDRNELLSHHMKEALTSPFVV